MTERRTRSTGTSPNVKVGRCNFSNGTLKTPLPRKFTFADAEKIREVAKRSEPQGDSESRQMLENGIEKGRGGVYLGLTPDQYAGLRRP